MPLSYQHASVCCSPLSTLHVCVFVHIFICICFSLEEENLMGLTWVKKHCWKKRSTMQEAPEGLE